MVIWSFLSLKEKTDSNYAVLRKMLQKQLISKLEDVFKTNYLRKYSQKMS